jgi:hypothetical protein
MSDIRPLTKQEIFDTIWKEYILGDSGQAVNIMQECQYRAMDNRKCFIGRFILEKDYSKALEGLSIHLLLGTLENSDSRLLLSEVGARFLERLQSIHDEIHSNPSTLKAIWKSQLLSLARRERLEVLYE